MSAAATPTVSVVIPTYNRLPQLRRALDGLARQSGGTGGFEVVVVSDGSTDGTDEWLRSRHVPFPVTVRTQANAGPAAARNAGVQACSGELVLFVDDDVVPDPGLIAAHVRHHDGVDDKVVIGPMNTPDDVELSAWTRWEQKKLEKQYDALTAGRWPVTPRQFYTGNASLGRNHIEAVGGFDPAFRRAEDVELAYRLADGGLHFAFAPDAVVVHYAPRGFGAWLANAVEYGRNDVIFGRDHGRAWLLDSVFEEFHDRHRLTRSLAVTSLRYPVMRSRLISVLGATAKATNRFRLRSVSDAALSALYNVEYYHGMADELGSEAELLARLDKARA